MNGISDSESLRFEVLGPLQVVRGGRPLPITGVTQRIVLAALLLRANRVVPFDELADALWDDPDREVERSTLRSYVKRLRQSLGSAGSRIVTRDPGYLIEAAEEEIDLARFSALSRTGVSQAHDGAWAQAAVTLREALGLWRGRALVDVPSARLQRERVPPLEQERLNALEWCLEAELRTGRHRQAVVELQQLVTADPLRERVHGLLMLALSRDGRQAEALAVYRRVRRRLVEELGVEPGPDLREIHQRVLAGAPAARSPASGGSAQVPTTSAASASDESPGSPGSPARERAGEAEAADGPAAPRLVPRQLPSPCRSFVGRANELKTLSNLASAASAGPAVAAIVGMAGIGKSALALYWAHLAAADFPDGQLYVNLRGFDPTAGPLAPSQAVRDFLDALHVPPEEVPEGLDAQTARYRSVLADKRVLVVLDNAGDAAQVRPLLPGGAGCMTLVTSRHQLSGLVAGEGAEVVAPELLSTGEAVDLVERRFGPERAAREPQVLRELVRLCGRLPLALSVAAARASAQPALPLSALTAQLRDSRHRLDALELGEPRTDVRAVLSWSYLHLSPGAARLFRLLGLHPGPDISAAAAAGLAGADPERAAEALRELTRAHLLEERVAHRFVLHDLLRAYAVELAALDLDEAGRQAALGRLLDHYLHSGIAADRRLAPLRDPIRVLPPRAGVTPERPAEPALALAWFEAERHVLLEAVRLAAASGFDTHAWQISWTLATALDWRGAWHDLAGVQRTAVAAARRSGDLDGQARALRSLAHALTQLGQYEDAYTHTTAALQIFARLDDTVGRIQTHLALAWMLGHRNPNPESVTQARRALELSRDLDRPQLLGDVLNSLGWNLARLGDHEEAESHCVRAAAVFHELGDRDGEANALDSLGLIYLSLGRFPESVASYRTAAAYFGEIGNLGSQSNTLTRLGEAYDLAGDLTAARLAWSDALEIVEGIERTEGSDRAKARRLRLRLED
jgi:DNA-binding SARP family transcriptional activator/Tfp pilus assembly protein PilF